jgi:Asp-tRNA(Asn)/Glu-tRNA(Gln) amidotransferase A subunit family amidase
MNELDAVAAMSLAEASAKLRAKQVRSIDLTRACLERIQRLDGEINAFITVTADSAMEQARASDEEIVRGDLRGPLHGIPIALKDLIDVAGEKTTAASAQLADNVAGRDADVTRHLRAAGAVLLGKTNLHEFAYGGSGVISHYGPVKNPVNPQHITGGSSSGSAAAVAANMCFAAIGTDTAGSIRLPAACCGIVGFKPTYGAVSTDGVVELSRSLDHVGPMTRTVEDARLVWEAIRAGGTGDNAGWSNKVRVGVPRKLFFDELDSEVATAVEDAIARLRATCEVKDIELPIDADRSVQMRESWNYHEQWVKQSPDKYDPQTLKRIRRGEEVSDEEFAAKKRELEAIRAGVGAMLASAGVDVIVTPTSPIPAPSFAEVMADPQTLRARELVLLRNTRPFNVWGTPAISVPCGVTQAGLSIGIQFASAPGTDSLLLEFAAAFERR